MDRIKEEIEDGKHPVDVKELDFIFACTDDVETQNHETNGELQSCDADAKHPSGIHMKEEKDDPDKTNSNKFAVNEHKARENLLRGEVCVVHNAPVILPKTEKSETSDPSRMHSKVDIISNLESGESSKSQEEDDDMARKIAAAWRLLEETSYLSNSDSDDGTSAVEIETQPQEEAPVECPDAFGPEKMDALLSDESRADLSSAPDSPLDTSLQIMSGDGEVNQCPECRFQCSSSSVLQMHIKAHADSKQFKCAVCHKKFSEMKNLKKHFLVHQQTKEQASKRRGAHLNRTKKTEKVMRARSEKSSSKCDYCGKIFKNNAGLAEHIKTHIGERPHVCKICNMTFRQMLSMERHVVSSHPGEMPHICDLCGEGFSTISILNRHRLSHTGERPFICLICGKGFIRSDSLKQHTQSHAKEKLFKCIVCGKGFNYKGNLKEHTRVHTKEKPFTCEVCGKGFAHQWSFTQHCRIHKNEKPFKCSVCDAGFRVKPHLIIHFRTHTGERPYVCEDCGKRFAQRRNQHKCVHKR